MKETPDHRAALSDALTKMEGLYRIIYGYNKLGEKPSDNQEYIASEYCVQTRRALADENGWTGRKCPVCAGHGVNNENHGCASCGGTGGENVGVRESDAPEATPAQAFAPQMPKRPKELVMREDDPHMPYDGRA